MGKRERGVSLQTVKNRIFRGRKIVKKQLSNMRLFEDAVNN
jgi:DNA-directed RNA polymerase specialized sigma24 family protein